MKRLFALLLLVTACGPTAPIQATLKQPGTDVFYGRPKIVESPAPYTSFADLGVPNFPGILEGPPPGSGLTQAGPPAPACPQAPAGAPVIEAPVNTTLAPAQQTYRFRYTGYMALNPGPHQTVTEVPPAGTRDVSASSPTASDGSYTFEVIEQFDGVTTTTDYKVYPKGPGGATVGQTGETPAAGIYLTSLVTTGKTVESFHPQPMVELMPLPAQANTSFQSSGVDPLTGQAMEVQSGQVGGRAHVDGCGKLMDAWVVTLRGQMLNARQGASAAKDFTLTLYIGTQFGGLSLADHLVETGTDETSGKPYRYELYATIDQVPEPPL